MKIGNNPHVNYKNDKKKLNSSFCLSSVSSAPYRQPGICYFCIQYFFIYISKQLYVYECVHLYFLAFFYKKLHTKYTIHSVTLIPKHF